MPHVRIDDANHAGVKRRIKRENSRRSIQAEVNLIIEKALKEEK